MKITVAVPTIAGREQYLESCLRTCVTQEVENLEILVSDNSIAQSARTVVESFKDPRIQYVNPPSYLPMSQHWDFVISQVSGECLTIIGDDDGLMPGCIAKVIEISQKRPQIIHHAFCNYYWPDFIDQRLRNKIRLFHNTNGSKVLVSGKEMFYRLCSARARHYDGPMVYHNFVPTAVIRAQMKNGVFFRCAAPDVYSAVALSFAGTSYLSVAEYLTISGQGARSNGAAVQIGDRDGLAFLGEMQVHFKPRFLSKSVHLALLDVIYEVIETYGKHEMLAEIDVAAHLAKAVSGVRGVGGTVNKCKELAQILQIAREKNAVMALGSLIAKMAVAKIAGYATKRAAAPTSQFLSCDNSVTDIYTASLFLADFANRSTPNQCSVSMGLGTVRK